MTVYSKKATIKFADKNAPMHELNLYLSDEKFKGIDAIILKNKDFQNELDIELVCSDINPTDAKTEQDIDELLTRLKVVGPNRIRDHPNDPLKANNHLLQMITNLDNPNIDDKLRSKAGRLRNEAITKDDVKTINAGFEAKNKRLSETSTDNSDRLKPLDEEQNEFSVGEIERA
jgi:hypothetical protein